MLLESFTHDDASTYYIDITIESIIILCINNILLTKVYSHSPEPRKSLCKLSTAYFPYGILFLWDIQLTLDWISSEWESCEDSNGVSVFKIGCKIRKL